MLTLVLLVACTGTGPDAPDADGDGTADPHDCAPNDPAIHPDAEESCNKLDDNCDGEVDEGVLVDVWPDQDGDGFGNGSNPLQGCPVDGWAGANGDCDDGDAAVNPGAVDVCNGIDDDCDGQKDREETTWFADNDGDGYGDDTTGVVTCTPQDGAVNVGGDCLDTDAAVHPGATELCNAADDDCDGTADLGYDTTWYSDVDADGFGNPREWELTCVPQTGWVLDDTDCRPVDATGYPGARETCNGGDDDCDGSVDEDYDLDGDGHFVLACPSGDDCDDADPATYTGAHDTCQDGVDEDCDGTDPHCGFEGVTDLAGADVRATGSLVGYTAGHVDHGDFDGDGYEDLLFNALYDSAAVIVHGPFDGAIDLGTEATYFQGDMAAIYGARSIGVGDVNDDGLDDVGFGAPYGSDQGLYILFGPADTDTDASDADVYLATVTSTYGGHGADIADVTGDGIADGIVGAYAAQYHGGTGLTYVWDGPLDGDYDIDDVSSFIYDSSGAGYAGRWERGDGDVNGDGVGDLLVAAPYASSSAYYGGKVFVIHGPPAESLDLADADATISGTSATGYLGEYRTMKFGDDDGDGKDDIMVASLYSGDVSVFLGDLSGDYDNDTADIFIDGAAYFGVGMDLEDIDATGKGDILASGGYFGSGGKTSYLFYDLPAGTYTEADADATFEGEGGVSSGSTSCFADLNADGHSDVVIGAQSLDTNGGFYGEFYVW